MISLYKKYCIAFAFGISAMNSMPILGMNAQSMQKVMDAINTLKDFEGLPEKERSLMEQYIDAQKKHNKDELKKYMADREVQREQEKKLHAEALVQKELQEQKTNQLKHQHRIAEQQNQAKLEDENKKNQAARQLDNAKKAAEYEKQNKKDAADYENKLATEREKRNREEEAKFKEQQRKLEEEHEKKKNQNRLETELKLRVGEAKFAEKDPTFAKHLKEKAEQEKQARAEVESVRINAITKTFNEFFDHPTRMKKAATIGGATVAIAASVILAARYSFPLVAKYIEEKMFVPSLIQETSKRSIFDRLFGKKQNSDNPTMKDLHFSPDMAARMNEIKLTLKNTAKNKGTFQNYIFYGEPGTGKTAAARALAVESGIDYILLTGGDIAPLLKSGKAVEKLKEIFAFANKCPNGVVAFFDEADAMFKDPNSTEMSEELYAVLNAFLNLSGTESKKISLIFSTNHPNRLPPAIRDRVGAGQMIHFGLPEQPERRRMVEGFMKKYIKANRAINSSTVTPELMDMIAQQTEGLSGRGISLLILSMEKAALAQPKPVLTETIVKRCLTNTMTEHTKKLTSYAK